MTTNREEVRDKMLAERDEAIELLLDAQARIDVVQPPSLRDPVLWGLRAAVELCRSRRSILGLPVNQQLALARAVMTTTATGNHELARRQLERHGVDRYPTIERQFVKLVTEVGELGDEVLRTADTYDVSRVRAEAADVAICLYHLAAKLGFDLDDAVLELVTADERRFIP